MGGKYINFGLIPNARLFVKRMALWEKDGPREVWKNFTLAGDL